MLPVLAAAPEHVDIDACGSGEIGLLAWGSTTRPEPVVRTGSCGSPVNVGNVGERPSGRNQAASFSTDYAPGLTFPASWSAAANVRVRNEPLVELKVRFWILHAAKECPVSCVQEKTDDFMRWQAEVLKRERAGVSLTLSATVAADLTRDNRRLVRRLRSFKEAPSCTVSELDSFPNDLTDHAAINVYLVRTVDRASSRGNSCSSTPDARKNKVFLGSKATPDLWLHEITHHLALEHVCEELGGSVACLAGFNPVQDETNIMHAASVSRERFTEGQTFAMHFSEFSLIRRLSLRNGPVHQCPNTPLAGICPDWIVRIWPD
jgi:hypothetical protein